MKYKSVSSTSTYLLHIRSINTISCKIGQDTVVCLLGARFWRLRPEKKIQSSFWRVVLLYCVSFWFWQEIGSFFVVAGNFYYNRKKKIQSSVWRVRNHYYDQKKKRYSHQSVGCVVLAITTEKKRKIQLSVWWVVLLYCVSF